MVENASFLAVTGLTLPAQAQVGPRHPPPHSPSLPQKEEGIGERQGRLNNKQTYIQDIQLKLQVLTVRQAEVREGTRARFPVMAPGTRVSDSVNGAVIGRPHRRGVPCCLSGPGTDSRSIWCSGRGSTGNCTSRLSYRISKLNDP